MATAEYPRHDDIDIAVPPPEVHKDTAEKIAADMRRQATEAHARGLAGIADSFEKFAQRLEALG